MERFFYKIQKIYKYIFRYSCPIFVLFWCLAARHGLREMPWAQQRFCSLSCDGIDGMLYILCLIVLRKLTFHCITLYCCMFDWCFTQVSKQNLTFVVHLSVHQSSSINLWWLIIYKDFFGWCWKNDRVSCQRFLHLQRSLLVWMFWYLKTFMWHLHVSDFEDFPSFSPVVSYGIHHHQLGPPLDILFQFSDMTRYPQGFVAFGFAAAEQMGSRALWRLGGPSIARCA